MLCRRNSWYSHLPALPAKGNVGLLGVTKQGEGRYEIACCQTGLSQRCGKCCCQIPLCLNHIRLDKKRCCSPIRQPPRLLIEKRISRTGFLHSICMHRSSLLYTKCICGCRNENYGHLHRKNRSTRLLHCKLSLVFQVIHFNRLTGSSCLMCLKIVEVRSA